MRPGRVRVQQWPASATAMPGLPWSVDIALAVLVVEEGTERADAGSDQGTTHAPHWRRKSRGRHRLRRPSGLRSRRGLVPQPDRANVAASERMNALSMQSFSGTRDLLETGPSCFGCSIARPHPVLTLSCDPILFASFFLPPFQRGHGGFLRLGTEDLCRHSARAHLKALTCTMLRSDVRNARPEIGRSAPRDRGPLRRGGCRSDLRHAGSRRVLRLRRN